MDLGLKDKVAFVTGTGSQKGFAKATALTLAREGCNIICADIDLDGAEQTAAEVKAVGVKTIAVKCNVMDRASVEAAVDAALKEMGKIDILVNVAGGTQPQKFFIDKTEEEWDKDLNLNLRGMMYCTRAVLPHMLAQKSGKIINFTSVNVYRGYPTTSIYAAAKCGIAGFTRVLANEVGPEGINVNCIAPGMGLTNFGGGKEPPGGLEPMLQGVPMRRTTTPQDIANCVAFLASDISSDITGQNISVDGGTGIA